MVMAVPPVLAGAVKVTVAWFTPALAVPMVGAIGTTALTVNVCVTVVPALKAASPAWSASIVHDPAVIKLNVPPLVVVQTPLVDELNVGTRPDVAVAVSVGDVPNVCAPGLAKLIVWFPLGVTGAEAAEAAPVPALLVAVTVNV